MKEPAQREEQAINESLAKAIEEEEAMNESLVKAMEEEGQVSSGNSLERMD